MDPWTFAQTIAATILTIAATLTAGPTTPTGWTDTPNGPRCVNAAPCSAEAGNDPTQYTHDWTQPAINPLGATQLTHDDITAILADLETQGANTDG